MRLNFLIIVAIFQRSPFCGRFYHTRFYHTRFYIQDFTIQDFTIQDFTMKDFTMQDFTMQDFTIQKETKGKTFRLFLVEVTGLEPTTSWSLTKRATKLRYTS